MGGAHSQGAHRSAGSRREVLRQDRDAEADSQDRRGNRRDSRNAQKGRTWAAAGTAGKNPGNHGSRGKQQQSLRWHCARIRHRGTHTKSQAEIEHVPREAQLPELHCAAALGSRPMGKILPENQVPEGVHGASRPRDQGKKQRHRRKRTPHRGEETHNFDDSGEPGKGKHRRGSRNRKRGTHPGTHPRGSDTHLGRQQRGTTESGVGEQPPLASQDSSFGSRSNAGAGAFGPVHATNFDLRRLGRGFGRHRAGEASGHQRKRQAPFGRASGSRRASADHTRQARRQEKETKQTPGRW